LGTEELKKWPASDPDIPVPVRKGRETIRPLAKKKTIEQKDEPLAASREADILVQHPCHHPMSE
jgi:hypothetical protein